ncbi:hypothetical protein LUZ63_009063 [Rhynchospora breviuscula]|uniref:chalcone synthase n=1 Tax=Rhynchospora breviuscula TaxID=2022672 RepID=A0A9Q0CEG1_9POAL|nr:hypothetical protein LUZ63_009063 [Rhynchospora breviuscula]
MFSDRYMASVSIPAIIAGADPDLTIEHPLFQLVSAQQTILPNSEGAIDGHLREAGLTFYLLKDICISEWNSIFWVAHPGGPAILDKVEAKLELKKEKMTATRHVLSKYGNMSGVCVLFILDEMRT